jgi:hypothetical protein
MQYQCAVLKCGCGDGVKLCHSASHACSRIWLQTYANARALDVQHVAPRRAC